MDVSPPRSVEPAPGRDQITNAFWHACRAGQPSTAAVLLDCGADLNWVGHDGKTPYPVAQESGDPTLIEWLRMRRASNGRAGSRPPGSGPT
jgi:hypothetical protein